MLRPCCNICTKSIPDGSIATTEHYCERCMPFAQDFFEAKQRFMLEFACEMAKRLEKFRNQFLQEKVIAKPSPLKAVVNERGI